MLRALWLPLAADLLGLVPLLLSAPLHGWACALPFALVSSCGLWFILRVRRLSKRVRLVVQPPEFTQLDHGYSVFMPIPFDVDIAPGDAIYVTVMFGESEDHEIRVQIQPRATRWRSVKRWIARAYFP